MHFPWKFIETAAFAKVNFHECIADFLRFGGIFLFLVDKLKFGFLLIFGSTFAYIILNLRAQDGSWISNIKAKEFIFILKDGNNSGAAELSIDFAVQKGLVGFSENVQDDLLHFVVVRLGSLFS
jgi:hypothetical protein